MTERLSDGLVVVTGAGSGLGRALAVEFCAKGLQVAGFGRRVDALNETRDLISNDAFIPISVDISNAKAVEQAFEKVQQTLAPVGILINNAAIFSAAPIVEIDREDYARVFDINVSGTDLVSFK